MCVRTSKREIFDLNFGYALISFIVSKKKTNTWLEELLCQNGKSVDIPAKMFFSVSFICQFHHPYLMVKFSFFLFNFFFFVGLFVLKKIDPMFQYLLGSKATIIIIIRFLVKVEILVQMKKQWKIMEQEG